MPSYRMSGMTREQLDELVACAENFLEEPWDKETGRPKALCLRDALIRVTRKVVLPGHVLSGRQAVFCGAGRPLCGI